jgi:stearoyl-CoA 9-desaturase NADPH oxidoreductase
MDAAIISPAINIHVYRQACAQVYNAGMIQTARRSPSRPRRALRRVVQTFLAPSAFDFWATHVHPTWSWARPLARVVERRQESCDAVTLVLKPNRHWRGFQPGQHVNLTAEIDGTRITRSYSLSDAPRSDRRISITVKAIEGGKLSQFLCHRARPGTVLELAPAFGDMTLDADAPTLLLAAGSGITPLMAMIRARAAAGMQGRLTLLYWARTRAELCFVEELRGLAAQHTGFEVRFVLTRQDAKAPDEQQGRIDAPLLDSQVSDLAARQVFACGPGGFVETARDLLAARTVSFRAEAFTPPPRIVADDGEVQVRLAASGRTLTLPRGQSLLAALEDAGLKPAAGCRMGICNTCACGKRSGSTRHLHTGAVEHEPVSALRLCVSSATSDLVLDL